MIEKTIEHHASDFLFMEADDFGSESVVTIEAMGERVQLNRDELETALLLLNKYEKGKSNVAS